MSNDVEYVLLQRMYDGGPWNIVVTGSKQSVEGWAKSVQQTNPTADLKITTRSKSEKTVMKW